MSARKSLFELVDHACRICGGRVLQRFLPSGLHEVRCAECGARAESAPNAREPHMSLCFCGATLASGADAGLRCERVAVPTPEKPQEVIVRHVSPELERRPGHHVGPRPVRVRTLEWS